jgi:hypothetical protein
MKTAKLRTVASQYHGGQWSALYAFASTGTVTTGLIRECRECLEWCEQQDRKALAAIMAIAEQDTQPESA